MLEHWARDEEDYQAVSGPLQKQQPQSQEEAELDAAPSHSRYLGLSSTQEKAFCTAEAYSFRKKHGIWASHQKGIAE